MLNPLFFAEPPQVKSIKDLQVRELQSIFLRKNPKIDSTAFSCSFEEKPPKSAYKPTIEQLEGQLFPPYYHIKLGEIADHPRKAAEHFLP